jgi:hypothetical protein
MDSSPSRHIVSASRRTDLPAYLGNEFLEMLKAGKAIVRNPFGGKTYDVDLRPGAVAGFVFWSKNYQPFFPVLDVLDKRGDALYFLYTITGLSRGVTKPLEPGVPDPKAAIRTLKKLSDRYSPKQIAWRFDPVIFSNRTPAAFWLDAFSVLAEQLHGAVHRCIFSFCDYYKKVPRQLAKVGLSDWQFREGSPDEKLAMVEGLQHIAEKYSLRLDTCCEDAWARGAIHRGSCVDAPYLKEIFPDRNIPMRKRPTRKECGCWESRDIGTYATCRALCPYCYAL